mgnify:CR=1 FL=1
MKKIVLRKGEKGWTDEFGNPWMRVDANGQPMTENRPRSNLWTEEEEDLLREHLKSGGGFSWESTRELAKTLGRTVVAVRGRLTKIRREEKEKR